MSIRRFLFPLLLSALPLPLLCAASGDGSVWVHVRLSHKASFSTQLQSAEVSASHQDLAELYVQERYQGRWAADPQPEQNIFEELRLLSSKGHFRSKGSRTLGPFSGWNDYAADWRGPGPGEEAPFFRIEQARFGKPWTVHYQLRRAVQGSRQVEHDMAPLGQLLDLSQPAQPMAAQRFTFNPAPEPAASTGDPEVDADLLRLYEAFKSAADGAAAPFLAAVDPIYWSLQTQLQNGQAVARLKQSHSLPMNGAQGHWTIQTHLVIWTTPVYGSGKPEDLPAEGP